MKLLTKEIKIAMTAILATAIIYFGIMFLKNVKLSSTHNVYYVEMSDVNGLSPQSEVLANGMPVGLVKTLSFDSDRQMVTIAVELNEGFHVPTGTTATLTKDMLGAPKMKLLLGSQPQQRLNQGDTIKGTPMLDIMAVAGNMMPAVESIVPKLDSILTAINELVANPALAQSMQNLEYVTANLRTTTDQLNGLLGKDVPQLVGSVKNIGGNLEQTTQRLNAINFIEMADNANHTLGELQLFTNRLNNENSTLGRLMNDASVYNHLDSTMSNASLLLEDLREHPKRYVHFSIFGRKDKAPAVTQ
mgnify:CR=1 FL=1